MIIRVSVVLRVGLFEVTLTRPEDDVGTLISNIAELGFSSPPHRTKKNDRGKCLCFFMTVPKKKTFS